MTSKSALVTHAMASFSLILPHVELETRNLMQEMHIRYRPAEPQTDAAFLIETSEAGDPGEPHLSLRLPFSAVRHMLLAAVVGGATEGVSPATLTWLLTEFYVSWDVKGDEMEFPHPWREEADEVEETE